MSCTRVYLQWRFGRSFKSRWQYWWRTTSSANETWTKSLYRFRVNCTCTYPVVNDRWGATDVASLPLHFILFSASLTASQNCNPVHSAILFSQHFFCRSLLLPPCTVPYKIVLVSPDDLDTDAQTSTLTCVSLLWLRYHRRAQWLGLFCLWLHR